MVFADVKKARAGINRHFKCYDKKHCFKDLLVKRRQIIINVWVAELTHGKGMPTSMTLCFTYGKPVCRFVQDV